MGRVTARSRGGGVGESRRGGVATHFGSRFLENQSVIVFLDIHAQCVQYGLRLAAAERHGAIGLSRPLGHVWGYPSPRRKALHARFTNPNFIGESPAEQVENV